MINVFGFEDETLFAEMFQKLIVVTGPDIQKLQETLRNNDRKTAGQLAHKLKSSMRLVGALEFGDLCESIERKTLGDGVFVGHEYTKPVEQGFQAVKEFVDAYPGS